MRLPDARIICSAPAGSGRTSTTGRAAGRPYGIDYAFEKIPFRANTLKAHRLAAWAQARGDAAEIVRMGITMVPTFIIGGR